MAQISPKSEPLSSELDPSEVASAVENGEPVTFNLQTADGETTISLSAEEILVNTEPAEGLAVASDRLLTVAVDAVLTPELKTEGLAREIVRRIQAQRKEADFNIEDRIKTWYLAGDDLADVIQTWREYIQNETLTTELFAGEPPDEAHVETHKVDGSELKIGIKQQS